MSEFIAILGALFAGAFVGIIFSLFKLPIPAPQQLAGIAGIMGIYIGFKIGKIILTLF
jgi:XapX domain-containing protein